MTNELIIAAVAVIVSLILVSGRAQADSSNQIIEDRQIISKVRKQQIDDILERLGYDVETIDDETSLIVISSAKVVLTKHKYSLHLYVGFKDHVKLERINRWNAETRYANAYIDSDGDPVMELDLDMEGGVTRSRIESYFRTYEFLLINFVVEVLQVNGDDEGGSCEPVEGGVGGMLPA